MAYEICPECRTNQIPSKRFVCQECDERLIRAMLDPGPAQKWWAFLKPAREASPIVVPEVEPVPDPLSTRVYRAVRGAFVAAAVGYFIVSAWQFVQRPIPSHRVAMGAPDFVRHIEKRSTVLVRELSDALQN